MEQSPRLLWLFLLTIFLLYSLHRISGRRRVGGNLPPGPKSLPIVGSLHRLGTHPHRSLAALAKTYGPVMSLRLGQITTIVVSSPAAARQVLQKHDRHLSSRSVPQAIRVLGHDLASVVWTDSSTKHWKHLRSVYRAHLLSPDNLDAGRDLRQQKVTELIAHVRRTRDVEVGRAAFATILNLVSTAAFSVDMVDINSESTQEFKDLVWGIMEEVGAPNISDFFPALGFLDVQGYRRRSTAHFKRLFAIFDRIIDQRLRAKEASISTHHHDLLDSLLHLHIQEGSMDRQTIRSILADVFIAGTDTVSITVEWAMAELLRSPAAMERAKAELATAISVEEEELSKLPFLQAVVKETLRLHPPAPFLIPHRAEVSVEVCGYTVPEGSRVLVNAWAIGRDEEAWEEAEAFLPERFLGRDVDIRGCGNFELIPFGSGRRMCPGLPLAWRSVHLMLAALLREFDWRLPEGMAAGDVDVGEKFGVTLAKAVPLRAFASPAIHDECD